MGIYIKGMEMPKENELIEIRIYPNGKVSMVYDLKCEQIATATEVKAHGRLIDAEMLMEYCNNTKAKNISNNDIARFPTAIESEIEK